ncbi:hypothetical protein Y1Q_0021551 [Alligator mississippiensis]|uniref:Uncharacterized protein n=1 Tax=Alligator mississippiensis TaxID=8496 RepID=A0A151PA74_ALLMI|nr:hypothetical protein Y1Q_0021551 [Alligator mississippiensis]
MWTNSGECPKIAAITALLETTPCATTHGTELCGYASGSERKYWHGFKKLVKRSTKKEGKENLELRSSLAG